MPAHDSNRHHAFALMAPLASCSGRWVGFSDPATPFDDRIDCLGQTLPLQQFEHLGPSATPARKLDIIDLQ